ncbi:hypothetical protein MTBLM5_480007 [Magnetospirillum sp. LM-5]|uniref:DUF2920 family protein n=1 Tax=Magnetospirillum sp. LM-5 TaxID=2681466 RepID=UPI00137C7065|nr:DUF2920 family protein [Magnetospirillum sp. LM-5]CAA7622404.1 hypothetical protein MTBLM5_480007 [Magnetospirillum sp. LM-5]
MPLIDQPHPDVELGFPRQAVHYSVVLPDAGIGPRTGLVFYIFGFGSSYDDSYARRLLPYLANDHDCVAVAVDYQGAKAQSTLDADFAPDFFVNLQRIYGISVSATPELTQDVYAFMGELCQVLAQAGITRLDPSCRLIKRGDRYVNFGILPALDLLQVAARIIAEYGIDRRRIFAIGTSYGGYLALLLAKLAPNTFRFVVDNCGFSGIDNVIYGATTWPGPVRVLIVSPQAFSMNPESPAYLGPARQAIRDLATPGHYHLPSATFAYSYHGEIDDVASPQAKQALSELLKQKGRHHALRLIGPDDLDGRVFKVPGHGLQASMRGLFRLCMDRWLADAPPPESVTDFDLGTTNVLACADRDYVFEFAPDGARLTIC